MRCETGQSVVFLGCNQDGLISGVPANDDRGPLNGVQYLGNLLFCIGGNDGAPVGLETCVGHESHMVRNGYKCTK